MAEDAATHACIASKMQSRPASLHCVFPDALHLVMGLGRYSVRFSTVVKVRPHSNTMRNVLTIRARIVISVLYNCYYVFFGLPVIYSPKDMVAKY